MRENTFKNFPLPSFNVSLPLQLDNQCKWRQPVTMFILCLAAMFYLGISILELNSYSECLLLLVSTDVSNSQPSNNHILQMCMLFYIYLLFLYSVLYRLFSFNYHTRKKTAIRQTLKKQILFSSKTYLRAFCSILVNKYYAKALTFDHWELI